MFNLVVLKNPFNINERDIHSIDYNNNLTVYQHIQPYIFGLEKYVVSINGGIISEEDIQSYIPTDGDYIAVSPKVEGGDDKNPLAIIASIALMSFAAGLPAQLGLKANSFMAFAAQGAAMYIGGLVINHLFPTPKPDIKDAESPTYKWGALSSLQGQGNALAITYGTVRTAGSIVGQYIRTVDDKEYLHLLFCGGEGKVDEITDILINDNPLSFYPDVVSEIKLGTNDQTVVSFFSDTYADKILNYELKKERDVEADWATQRTEGDGGDGLAVTIDFPYGLYRINDKGNEEEAWIKLGIEYRKVGAENWTPFSAATLVRDITSGSPIILSGLSAYNTSPAETWTVTCTSVYDREGNYIPIFSVTGSVSGSSDSARLDVPYDNGKVKFTVRTNGGLKNREIHQFVVKTGSTLEIKTTKKDAFSQTYTIDSVEHAKYDVRVKVLDKSGYSNRDVNKTYWGVLTQIVYDDFCRPGKVLLALKIPADSQLSGSVPNVSWIQKRNKIYVFNPYTSTYEEQDASNPAWICYDMLYKCRKIKNIRTGVEEFISKGVNYSRLDYVSFYNWAVSCNARNLKCNIILDVAGELWGQLKYAEEIGRGKVLIKGTRYSCVWDDAVSTPVQMFTMGNIVQGSFQETFLSTKDRANSIEVSFTNKDKNYQRDSVVIFSDTWNSSGIINNPVQIHLPGIDNFTQAYNEGVYRLNLNKYLIRTVTFKADVDSIVSQVGDVILIQHDLTNWGNGGRIVDVRSNGIVLDKEVTLEPGKSYTVLVRKTNDTLVQLPVSAPAEITTTDFLNVSSSGLSKYDIYSFGETTKQAKKFRIINISRSEEMTKSITALEYYAEVYSTTGLLPYITPDVTPLNSTRPPKITGVTCYTNTDNEIWIEHNPSTDFNFAEYRYYWEEVIT